MPFSCDISNDPGSLPVASDVIAPDGFEMRKPVDQHWTDRELQPNGAEHVRHVHQPKLNAPGCTTHLLGDAIGILCGLWPLFRLHLRTQW